MNKEKPLAGKPVLWNSLVESRSGYEADRLILKMGDKDIVLLRYHFQGPTPCPKENPWANPLQHLSFGDPKDYTGRGFVTENPDDPWLVVANQLDEAWRFNCHTYAVGRELGLTPHDWINGATSQMTLGTNPLALLLEEFYDHVVGFPIRMAKKVALSRQLKDGMLLSLTIEMGPNGETIHHHTGIIRKIHGENWVESKLGRARVVTVPLDELLDFIPDTEGLHLYKRKE